jgi:hypothetical protein
MNNLVIPTTIVDGFLNNPDAIREYALKQDFFSDPNHKFPGKRSKPLHEINPEFFKYVNNKFLKLFGFDTYSFTSTSHFQLVDDNYKAGWVHHDPNLITIVTYLNKTPNKDSGTVIYSQKTEGFGNIHTDKKEGVYKGVMAEEEAEQYRLENNNRFQEEIIVKNKFNRLLAFDSNLFHGVQDFSNGEPRLTLISFVTSLEVKSYPIHNMHRTKE